MKYYLDLLGSTDPLVALAATPDRIGALVRDWSDVRWSSSYAPGKWSGSQLVLHLAHDEIAWSDRIRYALSVPSFGIQTFNGADWIELESPTQPATALSAYLALRRLNLILYQRITPEQRSKPIAHPEYGEIS